MNRNWIFIVLLLAALAVPATPGVAQLAAPEFPHQGARSLPAPETNFRGLAAAAQNPFLGSVLPGESSAGELSLSLSDAIDRGLKYNLGQLLARHATQAAEGERRQARSGLLPNITTRTTESVQENNLAAFGFAGFPGITNTIIGPFGIFDARVFLTQRVFDWTALSTARSGAESLRAANLSYENARDVTVTVVANLYLEAIADESRIDAARAELATAQALLDQVTSFKQAGVVPGIEVLRAQVELQARKQRVIYYQNEFEKQKLSLARAIGVAERQPIKLVDQLPYAPLPPMTVEEALERAYRSRPDMQSAAASLRAAEFSKKAAEGERLPSVSVNADFGDLGRRLGSSHETFSAAASLRIPIFQGGRVRGEIVQANAFVEQQRAQLEDLRGRIEHEIRTAFLDLKASGDRVEVARSALDLAQQELDQSRDRFAAGVTGNIEVVQAQEAVSTAHENFIASAYAYNIAKTALARALGGTDKILKQFLLGETK